MGFWMNLILVSVADIGFIIFVLVPGYISLIMGIWGPVFWIAAVIFSSLGIRSR
jgi:hypothetical protein